MTTVYAPSMPMPMPMKHHQAFIGLTLNGGGSQMAKDSRWLTLEVCREFARNKCTRTEDECRFAHPPPNVEVQNGRVMCCFDSIKGRCQRTEPPCKYLHPPQHLKEQLLQNGRNNLLLRNLHWQTSAAAAGGLHSTIVPTATVYPMAQGYLIHNSTGFSPYYPPLPPPHQPNVNGLIPMTSLDHQSGSSLLVSSNGIGSMLPALTSTDQQQPVTTASNGLPNEQLHCSTNGISPSGGLSNGVQHYWPSPTTTALSSTYLVEGIPTGTTFYSPTAFFQGVSTPGGMVPMMKGMPPPPGTKNGLTMYACNPYQQPMANTAAASMQPCYHPMTSTYRQHVGGQLPPQGSPAVAVQRY